ncbi:anti-sigma-K factor RskA [Gordonia spumicola]|uniref:Regulator of SigK n=1 Tax=Gordonia spumicola TaxID=589161 RepID=A0A7I9V3U3_9ACTN|nr:anti-sigma factor [Gordonia spumicola]GED99841.1 anti-sigma-K factor RskA [Gordonia spumicola]
MADDTAGDDLLDQAVPFALDALTELERARLTARLDSASPIVRDAFAAEVAEIRETLADIAETTALAPPAALRAELVEFARADTGRAASAPSRRRLWAVAAAAAVVIGVGGGVVGYTLSRDPAPAQTTAGRVFGSADVRTTTGTLATGRASVTYSPSTGAGVLVMNDVPPPAAGTVYQLWLVGPSGARLGGVMTRDDVAPSTTATVDDLGDATSIAFTVGDASEPDRMISAPVASLPLS